MTSGRVTVSPLAKVTPVRQEAETINQGTPSHGELKQHRGGKGLWSEYVHVSPIKFQRTHFVIKYMHLMNSIH
jgi:hypothetical protein